MEQKIVYLVRHGAYDKHFTKDITEKGREEIAKTGEEIKQDLNGLDEIVIHHGPRPRARQSAEVLAEELQPIKAQLKSEIMLDVNELAVGRLVSKMEGYGIIVSHKPDIEEYLREGLGRYADLQTGDYVKVESE